MLIECDEIDVLREPRLIEEDRHHAGKSVDQMVTEIIEDGKAVLLNCGRRCQFLGEDNRCGIYPTRPNCCVGMQPEMINVSLVVAPKDSHRCNRLEGTSALPAKLTSAIRCGRSDATRPAMREAAMPKDCAAALLLPC